MSQWVPCLSPSDQFKPLHWGFSGPRQGDPDFLSPLAEVCGPLISLVYAIPPTGEPTTGPFPHEVVTLTPAQFLFFF